MSQYTGNFDTDSCVSGQCQEALTQGSSLGQGVMFANMTKDFHGGRKMKNSRKNRKNMRKASRKNRRNMFGGAADYPNDFSQTLPQGMHQAADIGKLDTAFAQLPEFVGKYGMGGGARRRNSRKVGGVAPVNAPAMILTPQEEPAAFLNPQWYDENLVVPSYKGPENAYAASQYANQSSYSQKAGKRSRKASRKASRNNRKASRKNRKASRKNRKASRKNRKASRKNRKASRKNRKASRKNRSNRK